MRPRLAVAIALAMSLASAAPAQDPGPGISRELARARAAQLGGLHYELRFRLATPLREVEGELWLRFQLAEDRDPREPVVLDWGGAPLAGVVVNSREAVLPAVHDHVVIPADKLVAGLNDVRATFRSPVAPAGTPLSVYRDPADGREYAYTLVVPADAHRLYPCFDQPDLRGKFDVVVEAPAGWTVVANGAALAAPEACAAGKRHRFRTTAPLPTYLMAFAAGPFATVEGPAPQAAGFAADAPLRLHLRGAMQRHLDRDALVRLHTEGLRWLVDWCGQPYPFGKLDLVLLPGFPYGGMEHAGAIFYRESALVFDHPPTAAELVRRSTLVYHELGHQWFGNLVTMRWFDDLWLKEGFATFLGYQMLAALEPERQAWLRFLQRVKPRAYAIDGTPGTVPVYQSLQNLADAKSAYGPIVYDKAPAVLRELHERLGAATFRKGLQAFLQQHAFGAAEWRDLAAALEGAARQDLGRWTQRWLLAPSLPQVRVHWTTGADGAVERAELRQQPALGEGSWPLDLELLVIGHDGARRTVAVRSDAAAVPLPQLHGAPPPRAVLANPRDTAYGQFVPDPATAAHLLQALPQEPDPLLRAVGTAALVEAVREAELDPLQLAELLLQLLAVETDADSHGWLLEPLATCVARWLPEGRAAAPRQRAAALLHEQLAQGSRTGAELAAFRWLCRHDPGEATLQLCRAAVAGQPLPKGLAPGRQDVFLAAAALLAAGQLGDAEAAFAALQRRYAGEDVGKERFLAAAAAPGAEAKAAVWARYLVADEPPEQWVQDSLPFFHWPGQGAVTLPYLQRALERAEWVKQHRRIFFLPAWLDGFVNAHASAEALQVVDAFLAATALPPDVRQKLLQARDGLQRAVRIRARFPG